jgi:hypothetical protein
MADLGYDEGSNHLYVKNDNRWNIKDKLTTSQV